MVTAVLQTNMQKHQTWEYWQVVEVEEIHHMGLQAAVTIAKAERS